MDIDASRLDPTADLPSLSRAGFWRRWLAKLIDMIIVAIPFQILAAILFSMTAGFVQMHSGVTISICNATSTIPQSLAPPPPHDSNFAAVCRTSLFGAQTGATLIVGRTTREGNATTTVRQGYMLDKDGNVISGLSIDWFFVLAFLVYLVGMTWTSGRTWGDRVMGVRVADVAEPSASGIPLRKAIIRYLAMVIGFVPVFAILIYQYAVAGGGGVDAVFTPSFFRWLIYTGVPAFIWVVMLITQIAMKKDPVYDRLAGTAVVKSRSVDTPSKDDIRRGMAGSNDPLAAGIGD